MIHVTNNYIINVINQTIDISNKKGRKNYDKKY